MSRRSPRIRLGYALGWPILAGFLLAACATTTVSPIGVDGQRFTPDADERALWSRAEQEQAVLAERAWVYPDPRLEDYLARIAGRLVPTEVVGAGAPAPRVGVLADPTLNAFAMPDGRIYLHTGLLSRLESEAQLAAVLARELAHYRLRHALRLAREHGGGAPFDHVVGDVAGIGAAAAADGVDREGAAVLSRTAIAILGRGLQLAALGAFAGYGGRLEREADAEGVRRLMAAGWDPREMAGAFARLAGDTPDRGPIEMFRLGRAGALHERLASVRALLEDRQVAGAGGAAKTSAEFPLRMLPVVRENAWLDVRAGRFALARRQLDRVLAANPDDPVATLYAGDLHRLLAQRAPSPEDRTRQAQQARERYERAAALDLAYAEPFRELGLLYYQENEPAKARAAFERYLALKPDAADARRIREYVIELTR